MKSLRELYKIGKGPSSSHTMGPFNACLKFRADNPDCDSYKVILYGSLSKTGKGHMTDEAVREAFAPKNVEIVFSDDELSENDHPNTMDIFAVSDGTVTDSRRVYSVGGGSTEIKGETASASEDIYPLDTYTEIASYCKHNNMRISDYVFMYEDEGIKDYLHEVWRAMKQSIDEGLSEDGELPGGLHVARKAQFLFNARHIDESDSTKENRMVCAYAYAVSEQNAAGGIIVTAPTCGSCGVIPAALKYMQQKKGFTDDEVINALAVGGLVGNLIKTNASISGAECGCQAEIGSACSMAAAALAELHEMGIDQIEYAAEVAMEHHLGLTCDPIYGLVQIPCIERNAVAAMRAINAVSLANFLTTTRKISFDMVVEAMYETGRDLHHIYRETSEGGLAKLYTRE
ncbi:MAG: L-serine ammonia-lyase [Anaerofustis stercorihominis]|nr:L-serine ammonia-lyase [Anaerofustis stercorihominis]